MRCEDPLYMGEEAGADDLIAGGRLQLGIRRGSPEADGAISATARLRAGVTPTWAGVVRRVFLDLSRGEATGAYTMERATVVAATRTPRKVRWPDWWET